MKYSNKMCILQNNIDENNDSKNSTFWGIGARTFGIAYISVSGGVTYIYNPCLKVEELDAKH